MTESRRQTGQMGEDEAARHLIAKGLTVLERNVRLRAGEIDIVARDGDEIVFVEVRSRRTRTMGTALESVDARKQRKLIQLARIYLAARGLHDAPSRFDVVAITWESPLTTPHIEHITNAFHCW